MTKIEEVLLLYRMSGPWRKEDYFQIATAQVLDTLAEADRLDWFHASPNVYRRALQGNKDKAMRAGALGKRMGVKAGVFDCIIFSHGIALELKQPKGKLSTDQKTWKKKAEDWGWTTAVAKNPLEVVAFLQSQALIRPEELVNYQT